jgi:hypothetical protein
MHPMFAELFMRPDEDLEADERRRVRRARRSRQLKTVSATRRARYWGAGRAADLARGRTR